MHITLTGNLGSGKSTISRILEEQYGYETFSTGKIVREIAVKYNIDVLEMNKLMEIDHQYDHEVDDATAQISKENQDKNVLFDSRLAWKFVEKSFKVFLSASEDVAAQRVMNDAKRGDVETYASLEEAKQKLKDRTVTEDRRYKDIYGIDYLNYSNYDLVLDSTDCSPEVLARILIEEARAYEEAEQEGRGGYTRLLLSPSRAEEDFEREREEGIVTREVLQGAEFEVVTLYW